MTKVDADLARTAVELLPAITQAKAGRPDLPGSTGGRAGSHSGAIHVTNDSDFSSDEAIKLAALR